MMTMGQGGSEEARRENELMKTARDMRTTAIRWADDMRIANERERVSGTIKPSTPVHHLMPAARLIVLLLAPPTPGGGGLIEAGG